MSNICLVVLVGIPGVGKTQFYKYISDKLHLENTNISYISYDELEKCMERTLYKNFRSKVFENVDSLINKILEDNSKDNELIIIDDNMFYRSMRRSFYNLAKKYTAGFCEIFINCSIDLAIDRNCSRTTDRIPTKIILEMSTKFEPPCKDNSWEKYCEINSENDFNENDVKVVRDLIQDAMKNPVQAKEETEGVPTQPQNLIHYIDLMLRKLVGRRIKDAILEKKPKIMIQALSDDLLIKKKFIMAGLRNNELFLPDYVNEEELEEILYVFLENAEHNEEMPSKKAKYELSSEIDSNNTEPSENDK